MFEDFFIVFAQNYLNIKIVFLNINNFKSITLISIACNNFYINSIYTIFYHYYIYNPKIIFFNQIKKSEII